MRLSIICLLIKVLFIFLVVRPRLLGQSDWKACRLCYIIGLSLFHRLDIGQITTFAIFNDQPSIFRYIINCQHRLHV